MDLPFWQKFFNIAYPLGDTILMSLALIALRIGSGKIQSSFLVLVAALIMETIGDFTFTVRVAREIYWNGDIADLLYTLAAFTFGIGLILISNLNQPQEVT